MWAKSVTAIESMSDEAESLSTAASAKFGLFEAARISLEEAQSAVDTLYQEIEMMVKNAMSMKAKIINLEKLKKDNEISEADLNELTTVTKMLEVSYTQADAKRDLLREKESTLRKLEVEFDLAKLENQRAQVAWKSQAESLTI